MKKKARTATLKLQKSTLRRLTRDVLEVVAGGDARETIDDPFIRRTR